MSRLRAYLSGKTTSYRLNAYDDARIAALLVAYVTAGVEPAGAEAVAQRARAFIAALTEDEQQQRLLVHAFTLHWLNGLADVVYARFFEQTFNLPRLVSGEGYEDYETGKVRLFFWSYLLKGSLEPLREFAGQHLDFTLSPATIVHEIIRVQHMNIAANERTRNLLLNGASAQNYPKVLSIKRCAALTAYPDLFIKSAASTQTAAARWDKLFEASLRLRFGV